MCLQGHQWEGRQQAAQDDLVFIEDVLEAKLEAMPAGPQKTQKQRAVKTVKSKLARRTMHWFERMCIALADDGSP